MATISWNASTSASDLDKVWRIVQLQLANAFNFVTPEFDLLSNKLPRLRINLSARQMILPLDINDGYGVASIPENGWEAVPSSPNVVDSQFTWITLHKRFALSRTARHLDRGGNSEAMVMKQLRYQGMKAVQDIKRRVGDYFYGFGTGTMHKLTGAPSSSVYTPKDLYGLSGLGGTGQGMADFIVRQFKVGDRIAILNPTGPALRGTTIDITAVNSATGAITMSATPSGATTDDLVVFGNSVENALIAQTDRSNALTGLLDFMQSASVQNVATATVPHWAVGHSDIVAGRWGTVQLRQGKQGIANKGGGTMDTILINQGVENDLVAGLRGGLRFQNAFSMEVDGKASTRGASMTSTQRVPPGYVFGWDKKNSLARIQLLEGLSEPGWDAAEKVENRASFVFPIDWPLQMVCKNRANLAYWSGKTEQ